MSRRGAVAMMLAARASSTVAKTRARPGAPPEVTAPGNSPVERLDVETKGLEGWTQVAGQWAAEEMDGAPSGKRRPRATGDHDPFNVIVVLLGPDTDGNPDASVLVQKLKGTQTVGVGMPIDAPPLPDEQIQMIADWVKSGAFPDDREGEH